MSELRLQTPVNRQMLSTVFMRRPAVNRFCCWKELLQRSNWFTLPYRSMILSRRVNDDDHHDGFTKWPFMTTHTWGEYPQGTWSLEVSRKLSSELVQRCHNEFSFNTYRHCVLRINGNGSLVVNYWTFKDNTRYMQLQTGSRIRLQLERWAKFSACLLGNNIWDKE